MPLELELTFSVSNDIIIFSRSQSPLALTETNYKCTHVHFSVSDWQNVTNKHGTRIERNILPEIK